MDINEQKQYVFKKDYVCNGGTIQQGSILVLMRGLFYLNGGMLDSSGIRFFTKMLNNQKLKDEYLRETNQIYNKV